MKQFKNTPHSEFFLEIAENVCSVILFQNNDNNHNNYNNNNNDNNKKNNDNDKSAILFQNTI